MSREIKNRAWDKRKEEGIGLLKKTVLGEYVRLKCKNCGKINGTFTHAKYFYTDCDCTILKTGTRFRTTNDTTREQ